MNTLINNKSKIVKLNRDILITSIKYHPKRYLKVQKPKKTANNNNKINNTIRINKIVKQTILLSTKE